MKKVKILLVFVLLFTVVACAPTIATKSITEITGPDGKKTVSVTKSLSQHIEIMQTSSTGEVVNTFK